MLRFVLFFVFISFIVACSKSLSEKEIQTYRDQGKEIAQATQHTLGSNLTQKMKAGGVKEAIPFCNTMAYPLTEKMAKKYKAEIKRTSHKIRNEKNKPSEEELNIIKNYQKDLIDHQGLNPIVTIDKSGQPHFYAPIILEKKCLNCHGTIGKELSKQTDSLIKSLYPSDLATGFKEGELRGIWSITFKK